MINYFARSPSKWKRWKRWMFIGLIITSMGSVFCFIIDRFLHQFAPSCAGPAADQFKLKISFKAVHYRFPHQVVLDDLKVVDVSAGPTALLDASRAVLGFSIPLFSAHHEIHVSQIMLDHMTVHLPEWKDYITRNRSLVSWARSLPQRDIRVRLANTQVYYDQAAAPIAFKIDFTFRRGHWTGHGFWEGKGHYDYEFAGDIARPGWQLTKIVVRHDRSFLQLWGSWQENYLDWKGFVFYDGPLAKGPLYILDIDGHLHIKDRDIALERLSFSVNGDKVQATARYVMGDPPKFGANITYTRQAGHVHPQDPLKNADVYFYGQGSGQGALVNGDVNFYFDTPLERLRLGFEGLNAFAINNKFLQLKVRQGESSLWYNGHEHKISFEDLWAGAQPDQDARETMILSARLYGGRYQGQVMVDTGAKPWQIKAQGKIEEVEAGRMNEVLEYFTKCRGRLSADFDVRAPRDPVLSGTLSMRDGDFADLSFLKWVSRTFQIPVLEHLSGADLFCRFKVDTQSMALEDLRLRTPDLDLSGFFRVDADDLVSSRIFMRFSEKVLNGSPIGRKIIGLVPEAWALPFEFRLSGNFHHMNFQWDDSPLKRKVRQRIPHFIERTIERRVEEIAK